MSGGGARVGLGVEDLPPLATGRFYDLWLLGAHGELVALGSLRGDDAA